MDEGQLLIEGMQAKCPKAGKKTWEKYMSLLEGKEAQWSHGKQMFIINRTESYRCTV